MKKVKFWLLDAVEYCTITFGIIPRKGWMLIVGVFALLASVFNLPVALLALAITLLALLALIWWVIATTDGPTEERYFSALMGSYKDDY